MEDYVIKPIRIIFLGYFLSGLFMTFLSILFSFEAFLLRDKIILIACIIYFGLASLIFFVKWITLKPILIVKNEGLYCHNIFIAWSFITDFSVSSFIGNSEFILIHFKDYDAVLNKFPVWKKKLFKMNKNFAEETLPIMLLGTGLKSRDVLNNLKKYLEYVNINNQNQQVGTICK